MGKLIMRKIIRYTAASVPYTEILHLWAEE